MLILPLSPGAQVQPNSIVPEDATGVAKQQISDMRGNVRSAFE
jgi:hypothetical protein